MTSVVIVVTTIKVYNAPHAGCGLHPHPFFAALPTRARWLEARETTAARRQHRYMRAGDGVEKHLRLLHTGKITVTVTARSRKPAARVVDVLPLGWQV